MTQVVLDSDDRPSEERARLARLMSLFASLPPPPDPYDLYPRYDELKRRFVDEATGSDSDAIESAFLLLYAHLHGYEVPFTPGERARFLELGGHLSHAGGLSPILKARPYIHADTVSGDFGSGNGLQGLLLQVLYPHRKTVQIELSSQLTDAGRHLQRWIGVPDERIEWIVGDIRDASPIDMDFVYIYRPVRPNGPGRAFYERFAAELDRSNRPVVVFSIADCLRPFLSARFEQLYSDGHLTCYRARQPRAER